MTKIVPGDIQEIIFDSKLVLTYYFLENTKNWLLWNFFTRLKNISCLKTPYAFSIWNPSLFIEISFIGIIDYLDSLFWREQLCLCQYIIIIPNQICFLLLFKFLLLSSKRAVCGDVVGVFVVVVMFCEILQSAVVSPGP